MVFASRSCHIKVVSAVIAIFTAAVTVKLTFEVLSSFTDFISIPNTSARDCSKTHFFYAFFQKASRQLMILLCQTLDSFSALFCIPIAQFNWEGEDFKGRVALSLMNTATI